MTHLIIGFIGFIIFAIGFKSWKYGAAFVLGHLIPDLISFGVTGIKQGSADPGVIMTNPLFSPLALITHSPTIGFLCNSIVPAQWKENVQGNIQDVGSCTCCFPYRSCSAPDS
jgi:hypothetical protein